MTTTQEKLMALVTKPTSGDKVRAIRTAINIRKMQLESMRSDAADRVSIEMDLEALEACLLDYQPENRVRKFATG